MPDAPPHLFTFLTREEFKLCFAISFVAYTDLFDGSYPLEKYATPEGDSNTWEERIRQAIRYLGLECGFEFEAVTPHDDGRITAGYQITPQNMAYQKILKWGSLPDVEHALKTAIEIGETGGITDEHGEKKRFRFPLDPLRETLSVVRRHLQSVRAQVNPEALAEIVRMEKETLEEMFRMKGGTVI